MTDRVDLAIIGAGILGLAVARAYAERWPGARVAVIEKEADIAQHQTGRNSGVIHAGLYYAPGSLKALLCREGRELLIDYAEERGIPYKLAGKLVVALDASEVPRLEDLLMRGRKNGLVGLRELVGPEIRELEPNLEGVRAIHVPETGIIDYRVVAASLASELVTFGGSIRLNSTVVGIATDHEECRIQLQTGEVLAARQVVACAGVQSDRVARLTGPDTGAYRIAPFRGDYFVLTEAAAGLVDRLVYPVPDPAFPFLGVHFTPRMDGGVWAGPNAVPSFAREGYRRAAFEFADARELASYPGVWRLARKYWRTGAREIWRDTVKGAAVADMRRYLPALRAEHVSLGPCGIRAQVVARDGALLDDFLLERRGRVLHVINAPSPAATASLAIARRLVTELESAT